MEVKQSRPWPERFKPGKQTGEAALIDRARNGEKQAIGELYTRYVDVIYRYVCVRVKDSTVAEDLTAQVFLNAIEDLPAYRPTGAPFLAWLYRIACARVADYWRSIYRHREVTLAPSLPADLPDPGIGVDAEMDWCTAIDLIAELTDDQQEVLILRFVGEMSMAEIAATLGKTDGAVKAIQHRALATVARLLKERNDRFGKSDGSRAGSRSR